MLASVVPSDEVRGRSRLGARAPRPPLQRADAPRGRRRARARRGPARELGPLSSPSRAVRAPAQYEKTYVERNPSITSVDTSPHMSEHEANTERLVVKTAQARHYEGGWPKDVDYTEPKDVSRFRKKAEKDDDYKAAVKALGPVISRCMKQNNTIDIYEEYFAGDASDHSGEPPSAKGLAVFRDPNTVKRTATRINWHPEGPTKIAVSYSILNFQDSRFVGAHAGRVIHLGRAQPQHARPGAAAAEPAVLPALQPQVDRHARRRPYNGLVTYYDLRRGVSTPPRRPSSRSRTTTPCTRCSGSRPRRATRARRSRPTARCSGGTRGGSASRWTGCSSRPTRRAAAWCSAARARVQLGGGPDQVPVGTEQGIVLSINLRNRKQNNGIAVYDNGPGKHHGPIYAIERNPTHNKFFMTAGDWTARIWVEDLKTPIMTTKYHSSYLTSGCWSPTRAGVFYVTRMDGVVDIWDYFYRQNEVAYSHKVGDAALSTISVSPPSGRLVAVGDVNGTVSLLEVCESLAAPQANEKTAISNMFDRETKQEKNLEVRERDLKRAKLAEAEARSKEAADKKDGKDEKMEELLRKVDADFLAMITEAEDDESKASEGVEADEK